MALSSIHEILVPFHSRKLLLSPSFNQSSTSPPPSSKDLLEPSTRSNASFDENIVMVIIVLVCALICSVGLNTIINCAFRCTRLVASDSNPRNRNNSSTTSGKELKTGIDKKALKKFPVVIYSGDLKIPGQETECVICLTEFSPGNKIRVLPTCNHVFHVRCVDKWLSCHTSCPTCRHCLTGTCHKISGCDRGVPIETQSSSTALPPPGALQEVMVMISPLEPEGMIRNGHS